MCMSLIATLMLSELAKSSEIADVVYYLSSDEASFVNGQVIRVDGGIK